MRESLQKIVARSGISSRRKAEKLIRDGCVTVNGKIVLEPDFLVEQSQDAIKVDGRLLRFPPSHIYLLLNKPQGILTTLHDPKGRPTVKDLIKRIKVRVFPVGRLDYNTEGLLLLTNDGELAHRLLHPSFGVKRTYHVKVKGLPTLKELDKLRKGLYLEPSLRARARARICRVLKANAWLEMTLQEGRHREVRRMCHLIGHPVLVLRRIRFGSLTLQGLPRGRYRHLTPLEVQKLRRSVRLA